MKYANAIRATADTSVSHAVTLAAVLALMVLSVWADRANAQPNASAMPQDRITAVVDSSESVIDYTGSAFLHDWTGTSRDVSGRLDLDLDGPDGSRVEIRVPVASFDSGNDRRDRKMREVTDAEAHPVVTYVVSGIDAERWGRTDDGYAGVWTVTGEVTFHGQTHEVTTDVEVRVEGETVRVRAQFPISLSRFDVDRPRLAGLAPIDDVIQIDARLVARVTG